MKHIQLFFICLGLLLAGESQAQMPAGRTKATIVADALAQLPAETPQKYDQTIADLAQLLHHLGVLRRVQRVRTALASLH